MLFTNLETTTSLYLGSGRIILFLGFDFLIVKNLIDERRTIAEHFYFLPPLPFVAGAGTPALGVLAPYLERDCFLPLTPEVSKAPLTTW